VKNTLASVQAIAQHTLRRATEPGDFVEKFSGRIQSLSRVHSLLSSTTWQGAELRELIRDQLRHGPADDSRITTWGPPLRMDPQMALHLALMLHELGTNSVKYGALSGAQGRVAVTWKVDQNMLQLQWVERGGPTASVPTTRGFGTTLIEQSARGEGGDARMLVEAEGITWDITLPLPRAEASLPAHKAQPAVAPASSGLPRHESRGASTGAPALASRRFLVVDDEPLVALDMVAGLEEAGAQIAGPAGTAAEALRIIESTSLDGAMLDANLHGQPVDEIAAALTCRNVPFVFVTGYGRDGLPSAFVGAAMLGKPFSQEQLLEAATQLLEHRPDVVRLRE
jgi:two-component sensor histidine kinase